MTIENISPHAGYIDGAFVRGEGATLRVGNPSDGSEVACFPGLSERQTEGAILAARRSFDTGVWSRLSVKERVHILRRFVGAMAAQSDKTAAVLVAETGCPPHSGSMMAQLAIPLRMARECIDLFETLPEIEEHDLPAHERTNRLGQSVRSLRRYSPLGVVVGIAAYNFPLHTGVWKVIPALVAGNSVILRPNPLTPLSALAFAEAAHSVGLPAGVLNIVLESGVAGAQQLTSHPAVDMVTFTGSSIVGAQVATQAAPSFKRVHLELGGKSAQIFLPDATDRVANAAVSVCTGHAGQGCVHGTRLFVPQAQKMELLEQTGLALRSLKVGYANDITTQVGPVISAAQVARCQHFVELAVEHGGRVAAGGQRPSHLKGGYFFEPTLLDLPDNRNPAAQEEIFGPVVAMIGYRNVDHALEMANDSKYGLSGYVHGQNADEALDVAMRVNSGAVHVNGAVSSTYVPFGGIKSSGIGHERGADGLRLCQRLTVHSVTGTCTA